MDRYALQPHLADRCDPASTSSWQGRSDLSDKPNHQQQRSSRDLPPSTLSKVEGC